MALPFKALAIFAAVMVGAGLFTASSLSLTASVVSETAASMPVASKPLKPNYVVRMPVANADALNVAKVVTVKPKSMVVTTSALEPVAAPVPVAELTVIAKPTYSHKVVASGANVRAGPKKSFPQVFTLRQGSWVNIGENVQGWVKVTDETGREGWVYGTLLQAADRAVATVD